MANIIYSIIIPHFNDLEGLRELLKSIPMRDDLEIIVVDDNSFPESDDVNKLVATFDQHNIFLLFNKKDKRGAGGCRNIGIENSIGRWLIFSDSDDYFTEEAFDAFDTYKESEADIIYFHMTSINLPERTKGTRHIQYETILDRYLRKKNRVNELGVRYNFPSPCAKMVRRSMVMNNHLRYDDIRWSNDDMFSTMCGYYAKEVAVSEKVVYCATRQNGTITTLKNTEAFKTSIDVYIRKLLFIKERLPYTEFRKTIRWPGNKFILSYINGYDKEIRRYIYNQYRRNGVSIFWINRFDLYEIKDRLKSFYSDRKYTQ